LANNITSQERMDTSDEKIKKMQPKLQVHAHLSRNAVCCLTTPWNFSIPHPAVSLENAAKALAISKEINFAAGKGRSYLCMGLVHINLSEYEEAFALLEQSYHSFTEAGDHWGRSNALNNSGLIYLRLGDYTRALEYFSSSLQIKKESHDAFGTANVMISMAAVHREAGHLEDAQMLLTESLKISKEIKAEALTAKGLMELGIMLSMENNFPAATEHFTDARTLFESIKNLQGIAQCVLQLGKIKSTSGDSISAVALFKEGQKIAESAGDKSLLSIFLYHLAASKLKFNEPQDAISLLIDAKTIAEKTEEKPLLAMISELLSQGYETIGNFKDALAGYKNFIGLKQDINAAETSRLLQNLKVSAKVEALELKNKMLEMEKMAAIGQFTAGVAHEINNPVNFITANISPVQKNISDIITLLEHYEGMLNAKPLSEQHTPVRNLREALEIDYAIDETNQLLNGVANRCEADQRNCKCVASHYPARRSIF
jgi:tetratricopeptide (TPR) repeat protein